MREFGELVRFALCSLFDYWFALFVVIRYSLGVFLFTCILCLPISDCLVGIAGFLVFAAFSLIEGGLRCGLVFLLLFVSCFCCDLF